MNNKLEEAQNKFIERIGHLCDAFGLNSFLAKLYALLYLNSKPLSLDEISEILGVSKGNVSINIRELEHWGAVRKVWVKGSRKDFYEAELDIKMIISNRLKTSIQKRILEVTTMTNEFNNTVASINDELSEDEKNIAQGYRERIRKVEELKNLASSALNFADRLF